MEDSASSLRRTSSNRIFGLPIYDLNFTHLSAHPGDEVEWACGIIAIGLKARGVVAIGVHAIGLISFGVLSFGVLSFGVVSLGLFSMGVIAMALAAAFGVVAISTFAFGVVGIGYYAGGAATIAYHTILSVTNNFPRRQATFWNQGWHAVYLVFILALNVIIIGTASWSLRPGAKAPWKKTPPNPLSSAEIQKIKNWKSRVFLVWSFFGMALILCALLSGFSLISEMGSLISWMCLVATALIGLGLTFMGGSCPRCMLSLGFNRYTPITPAKCARCGVELTKK